MLPFQTNPIEPRLIQVSHLMGQSLGLLFSINLKYAQVYSSGLTTLLLENENHNCASSNLISEPGKIH